MEKDMKGTNDVPESFLERVENGKWKKILIDDNNVSYNERTHH